SEAITAVITTELSSAPAGTARLCGPIWITPPSGPTVCCTLVYASGVQVSSPSPRPVPSSPPPPPSLADGVGGAELGSVGPSVEVQLETNARTAAATSERKRGDSMAGSYVGVTCHATIPRRG